MLANYVRRSLSFLLALTMIFSLVPVQAFATEEDGHVHEGETLPTEAAVLVVSGEEEDIHVHSYTPVVTPPTCAAAGYTTYTCGCGDSYTSDEVAATGAHSYSAAVTPPTCGAAGYTTYTCTVCGGSYTSDEVAATGAHTYGAVIVAPTTEAEGYTQYTCSVCGDAYQADFVEKLAPTEPAPTETKPAPTESEPVPTESTPVVEEPVVSEVVAEIQGRIDTILTTYLGTTSMTKEEILAAVAAMDDVAVMDAQFEVLILEEDMSYMTLTEADQKTLVENNAVFSNFCDVVTAIDCGIAMYTTVNVLDGALSITDSANSNTVSGGTVTIKASGSLFGKKTNNITITNNSGSKANVSFDYTASSASSFKIAGATAATSGSYSVILEAGASLSITLVSK